MRAYMVSGLAPEDGALLVFAHTVSEARKLGYPELTGWLDDHQFIDTRVKWMKDSPWLFEQADKNKLEASVPHVIDNPICCVSCELWGMALDSQGYCRDCRRGIE